ncbi:squalene/phytoene synthase family protein [Sphingomonas sp. 1P08PE]|uniref:squalene/phytoene synthase family protein n=1 Tax=Sphingomonas sp. 1P08PE TaxID=554122 RepID=UPI0039A09120
MNVKNPSSPTDARTAERHLAIGYAPADARDGLAALIALDERLGAIVRSTREPMVGQMRLTWWHEALERLDDAPAPAEPVLADIAATVIGDTVKGRDVAAMIDGWEALLDGEVADDQVLATHARARGGQLFVLAGRLSGAGDEPLIAAGEGWALADVAANLSDPAAAMRAKLGARERLEEVFARRWSRPARGLGALTLIATMDVAPELRPPGHPLRLARLVLHRLTGR